LRHGNAEQSRGGSMRRESYSDYMVRRLREERREPDTVEVFKKDVEERTETLYNCYKRQAQLAEEVYRLQKKVLLLGGDPRQLELDI